MLKSVALSAGLIAGANAFWRMECPGRVGLARMDPIINPNEASPHAHTIHGSDGTSFPSLDFVFSQPLGDLTAPDGTVHCCG